jgi:hypothetical protein
MEIGGIGSEGTRRRNHHALSLRKDYIVAIYISGKRLMMKTEGIFQLLIRGSQVQVLKGEQG